MLSAEGPNGVPPVGGRERTMEDIHISPEEIANKTFPIVVRGYSKEDVETFLKDVASHYAQVLADRSSEAPDAHEEFGARMGKLLKEAQTASNEMRFKAEQAAIATRKRAEEEAATHIQSATKRAQDLVNDSLRRAEEIKAAADRQLQAVTEQAKTMIESAERRDADTRASGQAELDKAKEEANKVRSDAERIAADTRNSAIRAANEMLASATERAKRIQAVENDVRTRLGSVGQTILAATQELTHVVVRDDAENESIAAEDPVSLRVAAPERDGGSGTD